jgi:hypothetical protein
MENKLKNQKIDLIKFAQELGFTQVGIVSAQKSARLEYFKKWLKKGNHGDLKYLARQDRMIRREDLNNILTDVSSIITFALPYGLTAKNLKITKYLVSHGGRITTILFKVNSQCSVLLLRRAVVVQLASLPIQVRFLREILAKELAWGLLERTLC